MANQIGFLGTATIFFIIVLFLATAQGINVFDFIKKILNQILDTFKVLFTFEPPDKDIELTEFKINRIQNVEVKPFDSPDLAVQVPVSTTKRKVVIVENEIPMTQEDRLTSKYQEMKNEKNETHLEIELPKPKPILPVKRSLDRSIQVRSYLTDEENEYIETFDPSISNYQTTTRYSGVTSEKYPSQMNCMQPKDLDAIPTTYYQFFQT
jgi:hypothetical protein